MVANRHFGLCGGIQREPQESAPAQRPVVWPSHQWVHDSVMCESGHPFLIWFLDCASASVDIAKSGAQAVQMLAAKARTGHPVFDCAAFDCGGADYAQHVKQNCPADCSIHCQNGIEYFGV